MITMDRLAALCMFLLLVTAAPYAQQNQLPAATQQEAPADAGAGFDSVMAQANQAFMAMQNRQFRQAQQLYETAAGSNPDYQKMADFCDAIIQRMQEITEEQIDLFAKTTAPDFRVEQLSPEEVDQMIDFQFRTMQAGQQFGELGLLVDIPLVELGLDSAEAEDLTLGEYLGWTPPRGANERIWYRARQRALERQKVYAKFEIKRQQQQERIQRIEEFRRRRLERQGGQLGGGVAGGGGFGGGGLMGGGMGGGGFGGGFGGGMGGGFGGGMGGGMGGGF